MAGRALGVVLGALALLTVAACTGDARDPPERLLDGTRAPAVPVELEGVDPPAILTSAAPAEPGSEPLDACLEQWGRRPVRAAVVRVGVLAASVTLAERSGRAVLACDDSAGARESDRRWCGTAFGQLHDGRLRDPRLDLLCTTAEGGTLGLAWVEPRPGAAYVVVEQEGYVEVYESVGGLPVRVSTTDVDRERSSATFELSEHGPSGRLLRRYRFEAPVAG